MVEQDDSNDPTDMTNREEQRYEPLYYWTVIKWFVLQMTYTFLGALLFVLLEECHGTDEIPDKNHNKFISYIEKRDDLGEDEKILFKNVSKEFYHSLYKTKQCVINHDVIAKWWSFTIVTCYTIGNRHSLIIFYLIYAKYFQDHICIYK